MAANPETHLTTKITCPACSTEVELEGTVSPLCFEGLFSAHATITVDSRPLKSHLAAAHG